MLNLLVKTKIAMNKMISDIKLIIFDIDGTLINTDQLIINSYQHVFDILNPNYKLTEEEKISFLGPTLISIYKKYFDIDFNTFLNLYREYSVNNISIDAKLYDDVRIMLITLKKLGYHLAIFTSRYRNSALEVLNAFDLTKYFEVMITLDDVKEPKPSGEGIEIILSKYNYDRNQVLYVGDNETDYMAGKNANVKTALVSWARGRDNKALGSDLIIESYEQFLNIIKE